MHFKKIFIVCLFGAVFHGNGMKKKGTSDIISSQKTCVPTTGEEPTLVGLANGLRVLEKKQDEMEIKHLELGIKLSEFSLEELEGKTFTIQIEDLCRKFGFLVNRVEALEKENEKKGKRIISLEKQIKQLAKKRGSKKTENSKRRQESKKNKDKTMRRRAITEILSVVKSKPGVISSKDDSCRVSSLGPLDKEAMEESYSKLTCEREMRKQDKFVRNLIKEHGEEPKHDEVDTLVLRDHDLSCPASEAEISSDEEA